MANKLCVRKEKNDELVLKNNKNIEEIKETKKDQLLYKKQLMHYKRP